MTDAAFTSMPLLPPGVPGDTEWDAALDDLWPSWRYRSGLVPPLDDDEIAHAVRRGEVPAWAVDRLETIRLFGGEAATSRRPVTLRSVAKPRRSQGLGRGARVVEPGDRTDAGEVVQPLYDGVHLSTDYALDRGRVLWGIDTRGTPDPARFARFLAWTTPPRATEDVREWIARAAESPRLRAFTGVVNVETVGGWVIEAHFRPALEFFRHYGEAAITALLAVANGTAVEAPRVLGGSHLVVPVGAVEAAPDSWGERSWRRRLVYL